MRQAKVWKVLTVAAAALLLAEASPLGATGAVALVSATVLGPAETETAGGAVTVSKISQSGFGRIEVVRSARSAAHRDVANLSTFRIGGGFHASYAVTLPEAVLVVCGNTGLAVTGFRTSGGTGRLASDGTATFAVGASVTIPAGQAPGAYVGSYPVTVAYN